MESVKNIIKGMLGGLQSAINTGTGHRDTPEQEIVTVRKLFDRVKDLEFEIKKLESDLKSTKDNNIVLRFKKIKEILG